MSLNNVGYPKQITHESLIRTQQVASCWNCECFDKKSEICLEFNMRPPAKVIVFGCEEWEGEIPF